MLSRRVRSFLSLALVVALWSLPVVCTGQEATAPIKSGGHTLTYWCTDLNDLWHVDAPAIAGAGWFNQQSPCTPTPFPVSVPNGSQVAVGNAFWSANTSYPQALRAALTESGYVFHSNSPMEDFLSKLVEVRVEIRTYPGNVLTQELRFDPRQAFRVVRVRDYTGLLGTEPVVDPDLGLDVSAEVYGRLPLVGTPVVAGPVPPGQDPDVRVLDAVGAPQRRPRHGTLELPAGRGVPARQPALHRAAVGRPPMSSHGGADREPSHAARASRQLPGGHLRLQLGEPVQPDADLRGADALAAHHPCFEPRRTCDRRPTRRSHEPTRR